MGRMTANGDLQPPTADEIEALQRLTRGIMRAQGNRFIKELLRRKKRELPDRKIMIGANKAAFETNVMKAIQEGDLRLKDFDDWAKEVEGWGNQHVYAYGIPDAVTAQLTRTKVLNKVKAAGLEDVWEGSTILEFPEEPKLTSISFQDSVLRIVWQESSPGWTPVPEKNIPPATEDGGAAAGSVDSEIATGDWVSDALRDRIARAAGEGIDTWEYRAYRMVEHRAITRFEARLDVGLAALFIAYPIQGREHKNAVLEAKKVIGQLLDLPKLEQRQLDISTVSRNIDQANVPSNASPSPKLKAQKSRLRSGDSYVEFAARKRTKSYWDEPAVLGVRASVKDAQAQAFGGAEGVFVFPKSNGLSQDFRVQLYGDTDRIRLWAQMTVDEVWSILSDIATYQ